MKSDEELSQDATLELPVDGVAIQVGEEVRLQDGVLELRYMPVHGACVVTIRIDDQTHASVPVDGPLFAVLAAFVADPQRKIDPGTIFTAASSEYPGFPKIC
jgi:hypothetical protein